MENKIVHIFPPGFFNEHNVNGYAENRIKDKQLRGAVFDAMALRTKLEMEGLPSDEVQAVVALKYPKVTAWYERGRLTGVYSEE